MNHLNFESCQLVDLNFKATDWSKFILFIQTNLAVTEICAVLFFRLLWYILDRFTFKIFLFQPNQYYAKKNMRIPDNYTLEPEFYHLTLATSI